MKLKGPKFYTIKSPYDNLVLWVNEDKEFPEPKKIPISDLQINESTNEEKAYWIDSMEEIDKRVKNIFMGVSLRDFEKWKRTEKKYQSLKTKKNES